MTTNITVLLMQLLLTEFRVWTGSGIVEWQMAQGSLPDASGGSGWSQSKRVPRPCSGVYAILAAEASVRPRRRGG